MKEHARENQGESSTAVILYDELKYAAAVNTILKRSFHQAGEAVWRVLPLRVNLLDSANRAEIALSEVANAELVVLAFENEPNAEQRILHWLDRWAGMRRVSDAAVALWEGPGFRGRFSLLAGKLRLFTERHGLRLIWPESPKRQDLAPVETHRFHFQRQRAPREAIGNHNHFQTGLAFGV